MNTSNKILMIDFTPEDIFGELYFQLRTKEERVYEDELIRHLPEIPKDHKYRNEWKMRAESAGRLVKYISKKGNGLKILEVGCGNGWLSNRLSMINNNSVTAADVNKEELMQGARVFNDNANLTFVYSDLPLLEKLNQKFDLIIFSASAQYFNSLTELLYLSKKILNKEGEVHILDTPFYKPEDINEASVRTQQYYDKMGFPGAKKYYFQ